ncbi:MAG: hypothetical protein QOJ35_3489 [Solirubrobacteraceae bacterium]|jgi:uncharacterized protein YkwD|nr:hypothetical protein [Solirubrobacteraceae bacterium]
MTLRCILVAVVCCLACPGAALAAAGDPAIDNEERAFCKQINTYRAQNRLPALRLSVALTKSSEWLSASMARFDYFDHTDNLGRNFSRRITASGYGGATRGENIAAGTDGSASAMFNQWKNSAPHRKNMLSASFKVLGVGRAYNAGSMFGWYWTTDFGGTLDRTMPC